MLHGYLSCKESFYYQIKFLKDYYKITAPDILGFGGSCKLDKAYSIGNYCEWLKKLVEKCKIDNPYILAHSFGARVALKYLAEGYGTAQKLIITGGAGIVKPRSPQYMRRVKAYRRIKRFFPKFAEKHFGSEEYRTLDPIRKESYKKIVNEDLCYCAKKLTLPTLLIYGKEDKVTPYKEEGLTFSKLIKGSVFELIEGSHFCFSENSETFNRLVKEFLSK